MKKIILSLAMLTFSYAAHASDIAQKSGHTTALTTSHAAACSTSSGKLSRECRSATNPQRPHTTHF